MYKCNQTLKNGLPKNEMYNYCNRDGLHLFQSPIWHIFFTSFAFQALVMVELNNGTFNNRWFPPA